MCIIPGGVSPANPDDPAAVVPLPPVTTNGQELADAAAGKRPTGWPPGHIPKLVDVGYNPGLPPSYLNGFVPDPRFADLHAKIDAAWRAEMIAYAEVVSSIPLDAPAQLAEPSVAMKPARVRRPGDRRPAKRGAVRRLCAQVRSLRTRLLAAEDVVVGLAAVIRGAAGNG